MSNVRQVDDRTFEEAVAGDTPVLVDFWAPWCGPCRMVAPVLEEVAAELAGRLEVAKLNVDENPATAGRFGVQSIPTMVLFRKGEPVGSLVGFVPKPRLLATLEPHLAPAGAASTPGGDAR